YCSTAFRLEEICHQIGKAYTRKGNLSLFGLVEAISDIEDGFQVFATSSGMFAVLLVYVLFKQFDHCITVLHIFDFNFCLFEIFEERYGFRFTYWDGQSYEELSALIEADTKAIFIETPTNPLLQTTDLEKVSEITKAHDLLHIVDNTLFSPYVQKPLEQGAD